MATYVLLLQYTPQGIAKIKESPSRSEAAKKLFQSMGAEMKSVFLTAGQYDLVVIAEAPDDETMARICLAVGSLGNVRTQTLRAFPEEEYIKIIRSLP
jgi:uncharacterized protein with GYD domain